MLFLIPGQTELTLLATPLNLLMKDLSAAGISVVSEVQISLLGWDSASRFQIRNKNGEISEIVYDRKRDSNGVALNTWSRRRGKKILPRPDDLDFNPFGVLMGFDD